MEVHGKIDAPKYLIEGVDVTNKIKNLPSDTQSVLDSKLNKNAPIIAGTNTKVTYDTNGLVVSSSSLVSSDIPNLDASKITTGTIDINRLPNGALPELIIVANQSARFALTTSQVQNGDTVKQTDNNLLYYVKDQTNLSNSNGYEVYSATTDWSLINSKPQNILDISSISKNNDDIIQVKSGIYTNRTPNQFKSDLLLSKSDIGLSNVDNTSDATKSVLSATKLTTARTINGTSFDGTANITVVDSTKQPLNSSLTSISSLSLVGNQGKFISINQSENGFDVSAGVDIVASISDINSKINTGISGFKNKIINGLFNINQRSYTSGLATTVSNQYTFDRWRIVTIGGSISYANNNSDIGKTVTIPNGVLFQQVIESQEMTSGTYILTWIGNATAKVNNVNIVNGGTVNITYGTDTTIEFTNGNLSYPQFMLGSLSQQFEFRPYNIELRLCQRYFYKLNSVGANAGVSNLLLTRNRSTANVYHAVVQYPVEMRISPTVSFTSGIRVIKSGVAVQTATFASEISTTSHCLVSAVPLTDTSSIYQVWMEGDGTNISSISFNSEL